MNDHDRIHGLAADLPALGRHLAFRPDGEERQGSMAVGRPADPARAKPPVAPKAAGASSSPDDEPKSTDAPKAPDPLEQAKEACRRDLQAAMVQLHEAKAALSALSPTHPQLAGIDRRAGEVHALLERIEATGSMVAIAQLQHKVTEIQRAATETAQVAQGVVASATGTSAAARLAAASPEARHLLTQGSAEISVRTGDMFATGSKYGIDLTGEQERERELRKLEEEARRKGDVAGALGFHGERLQNEISGYDKLLGSGKLSPAEQRKYEARRKKAQEELEKTQREREKAEHGQGTGQGDQRTKEAMTDLNTGYGDRDKNAAWAAEAWTDVAGNRVHASTEGDASTRRGAGKIAAVRADITRQDDNGFAESGIGTQFAFDVAPEVKAKAKLAAAPAAAAGTANSSKNADLTAEPKQAPSQTADAGKPAPSSGRTASA